MRFLPLFQATLLIKRESVGVVVLSSSGFLPSFDSGKNPIFLKD